MVYSRGKCLVYTVLPPNIDTPGMAWNTPLNFLNRLKWQMNGHISFQQSVVIDSEDNFGVFKFKTDDTEDAEFRLSNICTLYVFSNKPRTLSAQ